MSVVEGDVNTMPPQFGGPEPVFDLSDQMVGPCVEETIALPWARYRAFLEDSVKNAVEATLGVLPKPVSHRNLVAFAVNQKKTGF